MFEIRLDDGRMEDNTEEEKEERREEEEEEKEEVREEKEEVSDSSVSLLLLLHLLLSFFQLSCYQVRIKHLSVSDSAESDTLRLIFLLLSFCP